MPPLFAVLRHLFSLLDLVGKKMPPLFAVLSLVLCFEFQKLLFLSTKWKYSLVSLLNNKHLFKTINIFSFIKRNTTCTF